MWTVIYEQSELNYWTVQELIFESMPWPDWTCYLSPLWRTISRQTKSEINSLLPHTWLAHGCRREQESACQRGEAWLRLKVKHLLSTQSGFCWWNQNWDHRWKLPGCDQTCALFFCPSGGGGIKGLRCQLACNPTPTCCPLSVAQKLHGVGVTRCSGCSSPVVIFEAVDLIFRVHGEGHSVKALVTDDTAEAAWVVGLPQGL